MGGMNRGIVPGDRNRAHILDVNDDIEIEIDEEYKKMLENLAA